MSTLGGHTDVITGGGTSLPYVRSGQLRLVLVFNQKRLLEFPNTPTAKDLGYQLPPLTEMATLCSIIGPKGLTGEPLRKLDVALSKAYQDPSFLKQELGYQAENIDGKETQKLMADYRQKFEETLPPLFEEIKGIKEK
jgi:tripartite-type tricarboxylate transporter receptor subunit TctC